MISLKKREKDKLTSDDVKNLDCDHCFPGVRKTLQGNQIYWLIMRICLSFELKPCFSIHRRSFFVWYNNYYQLPRSRPFSLLVHHMSYRYHWLTRRHSCLILSLCQITGNQILVHLTNCRSLVQSKFGSYLHQSNLVMFNKYFKFAKKNIHRHATEQDFELILLMFIFFYFNNKEEPKFLSKPCLVS